MNAVVRAMGAVVAGMLVAFLLVNLVELLGVVAHPFPSDFQGTTEEICQHVERFPGWVLAVVVVAWAGTALVSTWIAGRLGNRGCALVVGLLLLAALVANLAMLPYPTWFKIANLVASPLGIAAAVYWARRGAAVAASAAE